MTGQGEPATGDTGEVVIRTTVPGSRLLIVSEEFEAVVV